LLGIRFTVESGTGKLTGCSGPDAAMNTQSRTVADQEDKWGSF
jgi:hypothetical protein